MRQPLCGIAVRNATPDREPARRALRRSVAAVALAAALAGCGASTSSGPASIMDTAQLSTRTIDPSYSVAAEDRAGPIKDVTQTDEHLRMAAEIAIKEGKIHGAVAHLSKLAERHPGDKVVAYNLARHLRYIGSLPAAEKALNDGLAIHPKDQLLRLELAKVKIADGEAEEAVRILEPLREELPTDPAVLQALGVSYDRLKRHDDAQQVYAAAMELGRPSAALLNNDGLSRMMSGDLDGAIKQLRRASSAPGATAQVRQNLALALSLKGDEAEAKRVAQEALPREMADKALEQYRDIAKTQDAWSLAKGR